MAGSTGGSGAGEGARPTGRQKCQEKAMKRIVVLVVLSAAAAAAQSMQERAGDLQRRMVLPLSNAEQVQAAYSKSALAAMERRYPTVTDPTVIGYMNDLARQIADMRLTLVVFDSEEVRAGAFPGGYLYVSTGLIARMTDEAELAGVLAHQLAHLAVGNALLRQPSVPLFSVGGWTGLCSRYVGEPLPPAGWQKPLKGREQEAESRAADYLKKVSMTSDSTRFDEVQRLCTPAPREFKRPSLRRPNG